MINEPIEIPAFTQIRRRRSAPRARGATLATASAVLDEAFAELPIEIGECRRVDQSQSVSEVIDQEQGDLLGHIATEVASLNRRCARLSELLHSLGPSASEEA
jgi:hypothetical protein